MRYLDWDVLLFPNNEAEPERQHIPLREFKTTCYAVHQQRSSKSQGGVIPDDVSPLLTCYVPSLQRGTVFYISIHSWIPPSPRVSSSATTAIITSDIWQVRVVVDGVCMVSELLPQDKQWPHLISMSNIAGVSDFDRRLRFPAFQRSTATTRSFNAAEDSGRIKIELSAGYMSRRGDDVSFQPVETIICFSFVHAPLAHLERCRIAWPSAAMYNNPIQAPSCGSLLRPGHGTSPTIQTPAPPPPTPTSLTSYSPRNGSDADWSSRHMLYSLSKIRGVSAETEAQGSSNTGHDSIGAVDVNLTELDYNSARLHNEFVGQMLPPRIPLHAFGLRDTIYNSEAVHRPVRGLSMHSDDTGLPDCTMEDEQSGLDQEAPMTPATAILEDWTQNEATSNAQYSTSVPKADAASYASVECLINSMNRTRTALRQIINDDGSPVKYPTSSTSSNHTLLSGKENRYPMDDKQE